MIRERGCMPRLHHLALRTRDLPGLARFYAQWFGLPVLRDLSPRALWLGLGPEAVLMLEAATPDEPQVPAGSLEFLALHATPDERVSLREKLVQQGRLEAETAHTLYFRDPDGRRVGVSSYPLAEHMAPENQKPRPG
jgi:catechol 2,3-dioxygenase-like lactoylglutathione lyase family enzyme